VRLQLSVESNTLSFTTSNTTSFFVFPFIDWQLREMLGEIRSKCRGVVWAVWTWWLL